MFYLIQESFSFPQLPCRRIKTLPISHAPSSTYQVSQRRLTNLHLKYIRQTSDMLFYFVLLSLTKLYIMNPATQFLSRGIPFIFNTWIVRHLTQEDYAVTLLSPSSPCFTSRFLYLVLILTCIISFSLIQLYAVQFHLLVTCILFLSREGFRRACLRMDLKW